MRWIRIVPPMLLIVACSDGNKPSDDEHLVEAVAPFQLSGTPLDTIPELLTVRVTDRNRRPLAGIEVTWSTSSGGSLIPDTPTTDSDGIARARWILGWWPGIQAANATTAAADVPARFEAVAQGFRAVILSTGDGRHQCATDITARLFCWGPNDHGQLGEVSVAASDVPVLVAPLLHAPIDRVFTGSSSSGGDFTCALTSASTVYCWGANEVGQLGNGTTAPSASPVWVPLPESEQFLALSLNNGGACALSRAGDAYCWGQNTAGRFGIGTTEDPVLTPTLVTGGLNWHQVALADDRACGIEEGGRVYCWGGQPLWLGIGADTNTIAPLPVINAPLMDSVTLSAWHQCGLTTANVTYCWGANHNIGVPDSRDVIPDPIVLTVPSPFRSLQSISKPTFAIGLDDVGYWWGPPPSATGGPPDTPVPFSGDIRLIDIGTNQTGVCGVERATSTVYCWDAFTWSGPERITAVPIPRADEQP
jgi:hypothetical protein